jgi:hypothetical protein
LVFDFPLNVLVPLKNLVVFHLAQLESLVHAPLQLFLKRVHLIGLLAHQVGLTGKDLLVNVDHKLFALPLFKFPGANLDNMSFLVLFLLGQAFLDLSQIKKLSGLLVFVE